MGELEVAEGDRRRGEVAAIIASWFLFLNLDFDEDWWQKVKVNFVGLL